MSNARPGPFFPKRVPAPLVALLLLLCGCIPASREPLVFEDSVGLPKSVLGTYRTVNRAGEDAGRLELSAQGTGYVFELHSPEAREPDTLSGEFRPSRVPGQKDLYVFALLRVLKNGELLEQTGSPFLLVRLGRGRLELFTLVEPQAARGWFDSEVRYEDMARLRAEVTQNGRAYVRDNRPVLTARRSAKDASRQ